MGHSLELATGARRAKYSCHGRHLFLEDWQGSRCPPVQHHPQGHEVQGLVPKDDVRNFSD